MGPVRTKDSFMAFVGYLWVMSTPVAGVIKTAVRVLTAWFWIFVETVAHWLYRSWWVVGWQFIGVRGSFSILGGAWQLILVGYLFFICIGDAPISKGSFCRLEYSDSKNYLKILLKVQITS